MTGEKSERRLGFSTSATELEDKFEELSSILKKEGESWENLEDAVRSELKAAMTSAENMEVAIAQLSFKQFGMILAAICRLGVSIADIERRVIKLEKSIERLHLKVK